MPSPCLALMVLVFCAPAVTDQPAWHLDVPGAEASLVLYSESQVEARGNPSCSVRDAQSASVSQSSLAPMFEHASEAFDLGAAAVSAPTALGAGTGTTTADSASVFGIRGLGTPQVVLFFRSATNHSTTQTACGYRAAGHTEASAAVPIEIVGGAPGAAYLVRCQWEFSASAATPYETVPPAWPEDGIICQGGADITCPIDPSARLFSAAYVTGYIPDRTSAPVTGTRTFELSPGWSGGGVYPARRPVLFVGFGAVIDDVMTNPAPGAAFDTCQGEFAGRLTLTIESVIPSGACCRPSGCLVTTARACAESFSGVYRGDASACTNPVNLINLCCPPDLDGGGTLTVQDLFDFLAAYFSAAPQGDFNASGVTTVQDIFDFLAAYFSGC
ncbi:MAG: GC-type dockerin domain-anchored protein [Phycisphaerales bacterium]